MTKRENIAAQQAGSMDAYDKAQEMILAGCERDDIEITLAKTFPDVNAMGLVPTIIRRARRDIAYGEIG